MSLLRANTGILPRSKYTTLRGADLIERSTKLFADMLVARQLCVLVSLEGTSIPIGEVAHLNNETPEFAFKSNRSFQFLFQKNRLLYFALAYIDGQMAVNGSFEKAIEILDALNVETDQPRTFIEYCQTVWFRLNKRLSYRSALRFECNGHYGNNARAYELFLDSHMQYTCGRFEAENYNIEQAQLAKFALINELAIKYGIPLAGKDHLDIGCGWGGMAAYFQETFKTRSLGNTNSLSQLQYAESRYGSEVLFGDFLRLRKAGRRFDLITIVGMIEHLTPSRRSQLLCVAKDVLRDNGLIFIQCITKPKLWIGGDAYRFVQQEVFPGHYLESSQQTEHRFEASGFEILERFDDGRDYGLTAARWAQNIQQNKAALIDLVGARQYRIYLAYLSFASRMFSTGRGDLMRYLLRKA